MRKTSYILHLTVAIVVAMMTVACEGEWDTPDMTNPPYGNNNIANDGTRCVTIADLKAEYANVINSSGLKQITDDKLLRCTVIGNDIGGNIYKQVIVQDSTGAMVIGINTTGLFAFVSVGQQLLISLKDLYIGGYGEQPQIGDVYNGNSIGRMSAETWEKHVRIMPTHDMSQIDTLDFFNVVQYDMERYAGYLVRLDDVTIGDAGNITMQRADGTTYEKPMVFAPEFDGSLYTSGLSYSGSTKGYVHHALNSVSTSKLVLRTSTYAKFAEKPIPTKPVTIYGIATRYRNTWQILIRTEEDIKDN